MLLVLLGRLPLVLSYSPAGCPRCHLKTQDSDQSAGGLLDLAAARRTAVRSMLSVMFSCGVYDYSGNWAYDIGVPAKSGVGGGILGVVNRQLGIGTFSPRLDAKGNSVRGVAAFRVVGDELGLHVFDCMNVGSNFMRSFLG